MKIALTRLHKLSLHATDGEIGSAIDTYFDDERWALRYLVAATGPLIFGRRVLLSPASITKIDPDHRQIWVDLTVEQIKGSPDIDARKPVSRQEEERFLTYYDLMPYWSGPDIWASSAYARGLPRLGGPPGEAEPTPDAEEKLSDSDREDRERERESSHLRSANEVRGYKIIGTDTEWGHVEDFFVEDSTWRLRYTLIDTGGLLSGRQTLIPCDRVNSISWSERQIRVSATKEELETAPDFDPRSALTAEIEDVVERHFARR
ncbi:MAG: PRC-barrel domain-containing protein [Spirochaetaceae bacterium]